LVNRRITGQKPNGVAVFPDFLSFSQPNNHSHSTAIPGRSADTEIGQVISIRKLMQALLNVGLDCVTMELLTDREISEHRFRSDVEKLSSRLILSLSVLRNDSEYHDLPFALITGSKVLECCLLTLRRHPDAAHALVCFCDRTTNQQDIDSISLLRVPVLLVGRSENHPGAPGCLSIYQAETSRKISDWLQNELIRERQSSFETKKIGMYA
jgi:hypothetical protein